MLTNTECTMCSSRHVERLILQDFITSKFITSVKRKE